MPDELSELQENAEHGRENPSLAPISVTMAILAVCVAIVSLLGHRAHTEELLLQNQGQRSVVLLPGEKYSAPQLRDGRGPAFADRV